MRTTFFALAACAGSVAAAPPLVRRQDVSASLSSVLSSASSAVQSVSSTAAAAGSSTSAAASSSVSANATSTASSSAASASATANNATANFIAAINARNANAFASFLGGFPNLVQQIVSLAGTGTPYTLILPGSLSNVNINTSDETAVANLVQYHLLQGNYSADSIPVNATAIAQSALANYQVSPNLTVATPQVVVLTKDTYGTTRVAGASNATILANSTYQNFVFRLANQALTLPTNISTTVSSISDLTSLYSALSGIPTLLSQIDTAPAATVFAPDNSALSSALSSLGSAAADNNTLQQIIQNHVIAGQTLYSTNLSTANAQNANNQPITFAQNATGVFVTSGGVQAQVIRADVNAANGVVHVINRVLYAPPASSNSTSSANSTSTAAAASATSSASSVASSASAAAASATAAVANTTTTSA